MKIKSFFFYNIGVKQTIFKNTFWITISDVIARLLQFTLAIYFIRALGALEFGKFSFALAFVSTFVVFSNLGLSSITTKEISQDSDGEKEYSSIVSLKIILSIATLFLMLIGSFFVTQDVIIRKVIWILSCYILLNDFFMIMYAFLRARQKMEYEALFKISQSFVTILIVFLVIINFPSIESLSLGFLFSNIVSLIIVAIFFHFYIYKLNINFNKVIIKKFFMLSYLLGFSTVCGAVLSNVDVVMMGHFGQIVEAGWYNAAKQIITAVTIPSVWIFTSFFPVLSSFFKKPKEKLETVFSFYMGIMVVLALPLIIGGVVLAPKIIYFLYGAEYAPAVLAFRILTFMAGIFFVYNPPQLLLIIANQQKKLFWVSLIGALINAFLNLILIPPFSLNGAAVSLVITYIIMMIGFTRYSIAIIPNFIFNPMLVKISLASMVSCLVMLGVILQPQIYKLNVVVIIIIAGLAYSLVLWLFYKYGSIKKELIKI